MKQRFSLVLSKIRRIWQTLRSKITTFIQKRPFLSFFGLLIALFIIIAVGNHFRKPKVSSQTVETPTKEVELFTLGAVPHLQLQAKVEKSGIITVVAQSPGVVQKIRVKEGDHVKRGTQLVSLSTNYQGGSVPGVARQIAQRNYQFLEDNYQAQKDTLEKQRQIARTDETQDSELRKITRQSLDETSSLINLDQTILDGLNKQINQLNALNVNGSSDSAILELQQAQAGVLMSLNGARASLRSNQYQSDDNKEPAQLDRLDRDLTLSQLDLQERTLDLNKDLAKLNVRVSQINESLLYPVSPCPGTVERVFVKVGQTVNPGTPLFVIRGDKNTASAIILASAEMAENVSRFEPTSFTVGGTDFMALPRSVSQEPTDGNLHSIIYSLPDEYAADVTQGSYVTANVPIGVNYAKADDPFVPLDAVYQTQNQAYVLVAETQGDKMVAKSRQVKLGSVFGEYVDVLEGLKPGDKIIVNRNVIEGDVVYSK